MRPRIANGPALIYATVPRAELVAKFQVSSVVRLPLKLLWQSVRDECGITRLEFFDYFAGLEFGVGIRISDIIEFTRPVSLERLRTTWPGFHPPQGFRYISTAEAARLRLTELRRAA